MTEGFKFVRNAKIAEKHNVALEFFEERALAELETPIEKILNELRPQIEKGQYRVLLGEDASGRIPTLIIGGALKEIYAAEGLEPPLIHFIAGSSRVSGAERSDKMSAAVPYIGALKEKIRDEDESEQTFAQWAASLARRGLRGRTPHVLIVTDTIARGKGVRFLQDALRKNGMAADVAAIGIVSEHAAQGVRSRHGTITAVGSFNTPNIYGKPALSGVMKYGAELFAQPLRKTSPAGDGQQSKINASREIGASIAHALAEKFISSSPHTHR